MRKYTSIATAFLLIGCASSGGSGGDDLLAKAEARRSCMTLLQNKLGVPSTAKWPSLGESEDSIVNKGDGYTWDGWVEFADSRKYFLCSTEDSTNMVRAEWKQ